MSSATGQTTDSINFAKKCDFSLVVDDITSGIPITDTSFTLFDSIHELYPKASLQIRDTSAILNEYLGFVNGTKVEIDYGVSQENWKKCTYRVTQNSMAEQNNPDTWGGYLTLSLIHDYFNKQTKECKAYNSNISDIVKKLVQSYSFNKVSIDTTFNSGLWYQPYITDSEFIMENLLPFAYSTSSESSPFYCFIDSNNNFHFKNYQSMMKQNPKQTFYLKSKGIWSGTAKDTIITMSYAQVPVSETRPFYNRLFYSYDSKGTFTKSDKGSSIKDYPSTDINPLPIKVDTNNLTRIEELYDNDINSGETINNNYGLKVNKMGNTMSLDKLILTVPFNREIVAGDLIAINLPSPTKGLNSGESSLRFSGKYLVEATYQKWDGMNSYTMLVCGKQSIRVTNDYRNIALILNR